MPLQNLDFQLFDVTEEYQDTLDFCLSHKPAHMPLIFALQLKADVSLTFTSLYSLIFSHTAHYIKSGWLT
jgi:hypothetical protein